MEGGFCSKLQEGDIKGALPYVIALLIIILTICAMILVFPVIMLVRKVSLDLGLVPFQFKCPSMPSLKSDDDDEPLLGYEEERKTNAFVYDVLNVERLGGFKKQNQQRFYEKLNQKGFDKSTMPKPDTHCFCVDNPEYEIQFKRQVAKKKMAVHKRNEVVKTMNTLINSNNVYFTLILFLVITIMIHMCLIIVDNLIRLYDYEHMWRAIEEAKKAVNSTSVSLNIMQATVPTP